MGQRQYWNEEEERLLAQLYPDLPTWQVAQRLKRTESQIYNLELLTRGELMRRNSIHRYPPELKHTIRVVAKLKRKIREVEDEKQD